MTTRTLTWDLDTGNSGNDERGLTGTREEVMADVMAHHELEEWPASWTLTPNQTIDDAQIAALRTEAAAAGDMEQVAICERALKGDESARKECGRVIETARAMEEP